MITIGNMAFCLEFDLKKDLKYFGEISQAELHCSKHSFVTFFFCVTCCGQSYNIEFSSELTSDKYHLVSLCDLS